MNEIKKNSYLYIKVGKWLITVMQVVVEQGGGRQGSTATQNAANKHEILNAQFYVTKII